MPLMNKIFYKSYNNVANKKLLLLFVGGIHPTWYMVLLEHPSLLANKNINPPQQSSLSPPFPEINVKAGLAGRVPDKILRERSKLGGAKKAAEKRKLTSNMIAENILKSQRLTSGVMTKMPSTASMIPDSLSPFVCVTLRLLKRMMRQNPSGRHSIAS
jgi:hypothetical protein